MLLIGLHPAPVLERLRPTSEQVSAAHGHVRRSGSRESRRPTRRRGRRDRPAPRRAVGDPARADPDRRRPRSRCSASAFARRGDQAPFVLFTLAVLAAASGAALWLWDREPATVLEGMVSVDRPRPWSARSCSAGSAAFGAYLGYHYFERDELRRNEFYALLLFALGGMALLVVAADLIIVFLAIEMLSLSLYVMTRAHVPPRPDRGRDEVLPAGGVRLGVPALRGRDELRGGGDDEHPGSRERARRHRPAASRWRWSARSCSWSASGSRCRSCRSTCGRPTSTRVLRAR